MEPYVSYVIGIATKPSAEGHIEPGMAGDYDTLVQLGCEPVKAENGCLPKDKYAALYAVVKDMFAQGNESEEEFRLPNFRGRVLKSGMEKSE